MIPVTLQSTRYVLLKPPIHPPSFPNEMPVGYLIRLAKLNAYSHYRWLFSNALFSISNHQALHQLLCTEDWTGYTENNVQMTEICHLSSHYILSTQIRFCPACISEEKYWRIQWQIKSSVACIKHRVWLHDQCPQCGTDLLINKVHNQKCSSCNFDLCHTQTSPAPNVIVRMQIFLEQGSVESVNTLFDPYVILPLPQRHLLLKLMMRWGKVESNVVQLSKLPPKINRFKDQAIVCADALFSAPEVFWQFLQSVHLARFTDITEQQKSFVNFYRLFYKQLPHQAVQRFKSTIEEYAKENLLRDLSKKHSYFSTPAESLHRWVSILKARREYHVTRSALMRAIQRGKVKTKQIKANRRYQTFLYRPDIEATLPILTKSITAVTATKIIGVTKSQFMQLQASGFFKFEDAPIRQGSTWQYAQEEIENFLRNINRASSALTDDCLTIKEICQFHARGQVKLFFAKLVRAIISGKLITRKSGTQIVQLRDLQIDRMDFNIWFQSINHDALEFMTIPELAKKLHIQEEFAYQLVNYGYINHDAKNASTKVIRIDQLAAFQRDYTLLSKLADKLGKSSSELIKILDAHNIFPVDTGSEHKLRQRLYRHSELINVRELNLLVK